MLCCAVAVLIWLQHGPVRLPRTPLWSGLPIMIQGLLSTLVAPCTQPTCRPRRLLVFVNPFGGARRGCAIWENVVRPVFDKAGIRSRAVETQHGGHARALLTGVGGAGWGGLDLSCWSECMLVESLGTGQAHCRSARSTNADRAQRASHNPPCNVTHPTRLHPSGMAGEELAGYDGVVAIGGDGLFHEASWGVMFRVHTNI